MDDNCSNFREKEEGGESSSPFSIRSPDREIREQLIVDDQFPFFYPSSPPPFLFSPMIHPTTSSSPGIAPSDFPRHHRDMMMMTRGIITDDNEEEGKREEESDQDNEDDDPFMRRDTTMKTATEQEEDGDDIMMRRAIQESLQSSREEFLREKRMRLGLFLSRLRTVLGQSSLASEERQTVSDLVDTVEWSCTSSSMLPEFRCSTCSSTSSMLQWLKEHMNPSFVRLFLDECVL